MPSILLVAIPYLLAVVAALVLSGPPVRSAVAGLVLTTLAIAAASRVGGGSPSFQVINGVMLYGGLLLFLVSAVLALKSRRPDFSAPVTVPEAPLRTGTVARWGMPALLALLLLPSLWFVITVAGPDAWSLQGLRDAPFSTAGETLLAAMLLPASLVLAGIPPFGIVAGGPRFAPLAALLLLVVVVPMVGEGLEHWRSLYAGWLVLAAFVAAATASWPRVMACAGLFAIACGSGAGLWAGAFLTVIASLMWLRPPRSTGQLRLHYLVAGACGIAALRTTLASEVVYSVLLLLAVVLGVVRTPVRTA